MVKPLTDKQKERLNTLEPQLDLAIRNRDYNNAKQITLDIQTVLRPTSHYVRLCQSKHKLYELAMEMGDFNFAISGLNSSRNVLSDKTRGYLEATALLAICYIRMQQIEQAKPFIKEVLTNHTVIKSAKTRQIFHSEIINRFNEEITITSLKGDKLLESYDHEELDREIMNIIQNLSEQEIYAQMGRETPRATKELIFIVHDFSVKQLPTAERLALPSPEQKTKDSEVGLTIFQSIKRVIYNSLCDPESEIFKTWFNNGMQMVLSKNYIKTAVVTCLINLGIGMKMIAASIIALISKFGIEVYCEKYKPISIMQIRESAKKL